MVCELYIYIFLFSPKKQTFGQIMTMILPFFTTTVVVYAHIVLGTTPISFITKSLEYVHLFP